MRNGENRLANLEKSCLGPSRVYTVTIPANADDAAKKAALLENGYSPGPTDLVVYLQKFTLADLDNN